MAVEQICKPLENYFSNGKAYINLGATEAVYGSRVAGIEAFCRPLWGLAPLIAGGGGENISWHRYIDGIRNGSNPNHSEYWGIPADFDQRIVEMTTLGLGLALGDEVIWERLNVTEKNNFYQWLQVINNVKTGDNNWHLFKVIVNVGFLKRGLEYDQNVIDHALDRIESFYLGDGWYSDGATQQKDYYISFAIHYYCLIYAQMMENHDPERVRLYRKRASDFAKDFIYWFSENGSAIPFGRSMTYRFAQVAFWSALVFSGVEVFSWGVMKGIIFRHLRWWFEQPIFSAGLLTIGYGYPNLLMSENYNAPGSPYWALKSFLILALDDNHPFWNAKEEPLPDLKTVKIEDHPQMIICRDYMNKHVIALTSGQYTKNELAHAEEKYAKFAYSNQNGFSISKGKYGLEQGAFDSMLALAEQDNYYRGRRRCEEVNVTDDYIYSLWKPWQDVDIQTWLIPFDLWHVRIHRIQNVRALDTAEGGFAIAKSDSNTITSSTKEHIIVQSSFGTSGIMDLIGNRNLETIITEPNTNMLYPTVSAIPALVKTLEPGNYLFATAVLAHRDHSLFKEYWERSPYAVQENTNLYLTYKDEHFDKTIDINVSVF